MKRKEITTIIIIGIALSLVDRRNANLLDIGLLTVSALYIAMLILKALKRGR